MTIDVMSVPNMMVTPLRVSPFSLTNFLKRSKRVTSLSTRFSSRNCCARSVCGSSPNKRRPTSSCLFIRLNSFSNCLFLFSLASSAASIFFNVQWFLWAVREAYTSCFVMCLICSTVSKFPISRSSVAERTSFLMASSRL